MRARWTEERVKQLRALAAEGLTYVQAGKRMGVGFATIKYQAAKHRIQFSGQRYQDRRDRMQPDPALWVADDKERAAAQLAREIAAARVEAATAPLYRGGWPCP